MTTTTNSVPQSPTSSTSSAPINNLHIVQPAMVWDGGAFLNGTENIHHVRTLQSVSKNALSSNRTKSHRILQKFHQYISNPQVRDDSNHPHNDARNNHLFGGIIGLIMAAGIFLCGSTEADFDPFPVKEQIIMSWGLNQQ